MFRLYGSEEGILGLYRGCIGVMQNKMETTTLK